MEEIQKRSRGTLTKDARRQIEVEEGLENLSHYLDNWVKIPVVGWRFGLDALIGLVPNVGDTVTSLASFYILVAGVRYGVPKITLLRMAFNIGLDYVVGAIPFRRRRVRFFLEGKSSEYGFNPRARRRAKAKARPAIIFSFSVLFCF